MTMTTRRIDTRGLSCPQPVVLVDRAVKEGDLDLEILVDNRVSLENVLRMAARRGFKTDVRQEGPSIVIRATRA